MKVSDIHNSVELAIYCDERIQSATRSIAKVIKDSGIQTFTLDDGKAFVEALKEKKVKPAAARKRLSRVRSMLEDAGLTVERDKRGGKRTPQAPKGPETAEADGKRDESASADELEKQRRKRAKAAVGHINATLNYMALLPNTWATKAEEDKLVALLKRMRKNAKADSEPDH